MNGNDNDWAVCLDKVSKEYVLLHEKPTLVENLLGNGSRKQKFTALDNVSVIVKKGEHLGIIGPNGSGKTTLLKIISKITVPTMGVVNVSGRVVSLIDLQAGFHPELTGEENIFMNALLLGMSRQEIKKKIKKIIAFADIGQFVDSPLYTYSSGMMLRLGFSVAIFTDPDILVLDEMLSVGDQEFQQKSADYLKKVFDKEKTIILVSHNLNIFKGTCERLIWMENGKIKEDGKTGEISKKYCNILW